MNSNNINSKQYLVILAVYPIEKLIYDNMKYLNYFCNHSST